MARRRGLRPEEQELWHAVALTTRAMHAKPGLPPHGGEGHHTEPAAPPLAEPPKLAPAIPRFRIGEKSRPTPGLALPGRVASPIVMDAKTHARMTRGKLAPDARIDLHGMTLAEAHEALTHFVLHSWSQGMRLALVITGKGKRAEDGSHSPQWLGALRHHVPQWLRLQPVAAVVLQVTEAHQKHGGSGALYVYLRRG